MRPAARFVIALCLSLFVGSVSADTPSAAAWPGFSEGSAIRVTSRLAFYEDAAGRADAGEILAMYRSGTLPALGRDFLNEGYTASTFWLVLPIPRGAEGRRLILFATNVGMYRLDGFLPRADGSFERSSGSYLEPYRGRAQPLINPALSFVAPGNEAGSSGVFIFKLRSDSGLNTSFTLADELGVYKYKYARAVLIESVFAVLLAMLAYSILVMIIAKEREYFYYLLLLVFYILYLADLQGLDFQFLIPAVSGSWIRIVSPLLGSCALLLSSVFTKVFLGIDRRTRIMDCCVFTVMALALSLGVLSVSGLRYDIVSRYGNDSAALIVLVEIALAIVRTAQGYRPARIFLVANLGVVAGVFTYSLSINGVLPDNLVTSGASLIGQALQLILFAASLAFKLNLEKSERIAAQENLILHDVAFRKFVPFEFIEFLGKKEITEISLGQHVEKRMSVMFADIRSFTSLSEAMTPRETFDFINAFLKRIVPAVKDYGGFIDKFIGDAIMALFPHEPDEALQAAIEIQQSITDYNEERAERGEVPIRAGIGMHTGSLMLGIIGDEERHESTVISDAVNLASRVEKLNKFFGTSILITEETFKNLEDPLAFKYRFLGRVKIKGKTQNSSLFEVFGGEAEDLRMRKLNTQREFEQGLVAYLMRDFPRARALFAGVIRANREDRAALFYYAQAKHAMVSPPPVSWDGTVDAGSA
jgi:adenylate cyclase